MKVAPHAQDGLEVANSRDFIRRQPNRVKLRSVVLDLLSPDSIGLSSAVSNLESVAATGRLFFEIPAINVGESIQLAIPTFIILIIGPHLCDPLVPHDVPFGPAEH